MSPRCLVLLYHRIGACDDDPHGICVTEENFRSHVELIAERRRLLHIDELDAAWTGGSCPPRAAMITFDDGYAAAVGAAVPTLRRAGAPAVFFVTSACVGGRREFWWDELHHLVYASDARRLSALSAIAASTPGGTGPGRDDVYRVLFGALKAAPHLRRTAMLDELRTAADIDVDVRPAYLPVSEAQLRDAAAVPGIAIGGHSRHHEALARLEAAAQLDDAAGCRADLEAITGRTVTSYAYPYGYRGHDFDARSMRAVEAAGYTLGFAAHASPETPSRFAIDRVNVLNVGRESFRRFLDTRPL